MALRGRIGQQYLESSLFEILHASWCSRLTAVMSFFGQTCHVGRQNEGTRLLQSRGDVKRFLFAKVR